jgi:hypothetical protein
MKKTLSFLVIFGVILMLNGCGDDDDEDDLLLLTGEDELVTGVIVENSSFVSTFNLDQAVLTNENGVETTAYPSVFIYDDSVYVSGGFYGDIIDRYVRSGEGLIPGGTLTMTPASWPNCMTFISPTKAYVALYNAARIAVINPTKMTITKEIDISEYGLEDNNPDPAQMVARDGKLYVRLHQLLSQYSAVPVAQVLILDIATDTVEKVITDDRTSMLGVREGASNMFVDDAGDIYLASMSGHLGLPSGILRIRKGETEFDPDYYFDCSQLHVPDVPGNMANHIYFTLYTGGSTVYTYTSIPGLISDPPDYVNDRPYQPCKIDLITKTAEKINLSSTNGYAHSICEYDGKILWGLSTANGDGIFTYDPATRTASSKPVVATEGMPMFIGKF